MPEIAKKIATEIIGNNLDHFEPVSGGRNSNIFQLKKGNVSYALKFFRNNENAQSELSGGLLGPFGGQGPKMLKVSALLGGRSGSGCELVFAALVAGNRFKMSYFMRFSSFSSRKQKKTLQSEQILCIFAVIALTWLIFAGVGWRDFMHIYGDPLCSSRLTRCRQILCIFAVFPPTLLILADLWKTYFMHICCVPAHFADLGSRLEDIIYA